MRCVVAQKQLAVKARMRTPWGLARKPPGLHCETARSCALLPAGCGWALEKCPQSSKLLRQGVPSCDQAELEL